MNIEDYADCINAEIVVRRYDNQNNRWMAEFNHCEVKGEGVLIGTYGNGTTPQEAIQAYVDQICGKTVVFEAGTDRRREFTVPMQLRGLD